MFVFEFDEVKSRANLAKHGINFEEAQLLWSDPELLEIPARSDVENRYLVIGLIRNKFWSAVITYRNTAIRIISVHSARQEEVSLYENRRF